MIRAPRARSGGPLAAGLAVAALQFAVHRAAPFEPGDEGMRWLLSAAWAEGGSLFARFQPIYPPGQYVVFGGFLALFGGTLELLRLAHALLGGAAAALLFAVLGRLGPPGGAWIGALALALPLSGTVKLLAAIAVLALALRLAAGRPFGLRALAATGAVAGLLAGWREDSAALAALALAFALARSPTRRGAGAAAAGLAAGFGSWLALFALRGDAGEFAAHVARRIAFLAIRLQRPLRVDWRIPEEPFASAGAAAQTLLPLFWALPVALYGALLGVQWRRRRAGRPVDRATLAAALVGCAYLPQFLWERNDLAHASDHRPILCAVAAVALQRASGRWRRAGLALLAAPVALALALAAPVAAGGRQGVDYPTAAARAWGARVAAVPPWAGLPGGDGATMIVVGWGPGWYALEGTPAGTRLLSTAGRHLRGRGTLERLLAELSAPSNRWVLATPGTEPVAAIFTLLGRRYRLVVQWNDYQLWERGAE